MMAESDLESNVIDMLKPMFPNLSINQLQNSVFQTKCAAGNISIDSLFQRCLDDLLTVSVCYSKDKSSSTSGIFNCDYNNAGSKHSLTSSTNDFTATRNDSKSRSVAVPDIPDCTTYSKMKGTKRSVDDSRGSSEASPAKSIKKSHGQPRIEPLKLKTEANNLKQQPAKKLNETKENHDHGPRKQNLVDEIKKELNSVRQTFERKTKDGTESSKTKELWYAVCPSCRQNSITVGMCSYCGHVLPSDVKLIERSSRVKTVGPISLPSSSGSTCPPSAALSRPDDSPALSPVKLVASQKSSISTDSELTETSSELDQTNSQTERLTLPDLPLLNDPFDDLLLDIPSPAPSTPPSSDSSEGLGDLDHQEMEAAIAAAIDVANPIGDILKPLPVPDVYVQNVERADPPVIIVQPPEPDPIDQIVQEMEVGPEVQAHTPAVREPEPDPVNRMVEEVLSLFPDVDPAYVRDIIAKVGNNPVNYACNVLLENPTYPRAKKNEPEEHIESPRTNQAAFVDYYSDISRDVSDSYEAQCLELLKNDFKKMSVLSLKSVLKHFNGYYAPARRCIIAALEEAHVSYRTEEIRSPSFLSPGGAAACPGVVIDLPSTSSINIQLPKLKNREARTLACKPLKAQRQRRKIIGLSDELKSEIDYIMNKSKKEKEVNDFNLAMTLNEAEYEDAGQSIECQCCYVDFPFEQMVQCYEGHLFCRDCLKNYAKESVYGQGKASLMCMADGCDTTYPKSQLEKALPTEMISKYEERAQEESLNLAGMEGFVRCPSCDFGALMDPEDKVFRCHNPSCKKETCRHCKEEWEQHFGKPCKEIEKKDETKLRLAYEEKMTQAKVRTCHQCKAAFMKSDGCNRMTCRCGAKMCYICRKPNIEYTHFCPHLREPGHGCEKCTACSLWTNPEEDDERAVEEIRKEAAEERKRKGFTEDKLVGASPERKKKPKNAHEAAVANLANQNRPPPRPAQIPVPNPNPVPVQAPIPAPNFNRINIHVPNPAINPAANVGLYQPQPAHQHQGYYPGYPYGAANMHYH